MSIRKGPRLFLRRPKGRGKAAHWVILDTLNGRHEESTGCGAEDRVGAEVALEHYLLRKHTALTQDNREPGSIPVADVLALYARDIAPGHADPANTAQRIRHLLGFWGSKVLAQVNGEACREYMRICYSDAVARRNLEELRAAINYHRSEGKCSKIVGVWLPPKRAGRERWLTRSEAAKLILNAWRYREVQKGSPTGRYSRRHIARFALVALYTGSRASRVVGASFYHTVGRGFVDVERGLFFRRAVRERETKKKAPPIPLPPRLLAHLKRWKASGQRFVVEWNHQPVKRVSKAFTGVVRDLGMVDVVPHTLRHTSATWLMQAGVPMWEAAGFLGMSEKMLRENYGHHHPDYLTEAKNAFSKRA